MRMQLTYKIALCPTPEQVDYFKRACGTARRVWNWALNEWNKQYASGGKPNAMALEKQFNAIKYTDPQWLDENRRPWLRDIHRDAHAQPFAHLAKAWERFFTDLKAGNWQGSMPVLPIAERTLLISSRLDSAAKTKRWGSRT
jgi:putative transposase